MTTYKKLLINSLSGYVEKEVIRFPQLYGFKHSNVHIKGDDVEILKNQKYDTVSLKCTAFIQTNDEDGKAHYDLEEKTFKLTIIGSYVSVVPDMIGE